MTGRSRSTGRDRDDAGRARNARPRDSSGRPLERGVSGVDRPDEDATLDAPEALAEAQRLLDGGFPFHAHEILEGAWKAAPDDERALWQGLAQLAVGLTHEQRGNARGAVSLLRRGAGNVADGRAAAARHALDAAALTAWGRVRAERLEAGTDPGPALRLR